MPEYYGNICTCRRCNGIIHTIRRGDTLYLLSRQYNVTVNEIMRANSNVNIYNLQIGDQLCIPVRRQEAVSRDRNQEPGNSYSQEENMDNMQTDAKPHILKNDFTDTDTLKSEKISNDEAQVSVDEEKLEFNESTGASGADMENMKLRDLIDDGITLGKIAKMLKDL